GLFGDGIPENTAPAYELAIKMGYAIEMDVHESSDGVLFCYHDVNASRLCGIDKDVRQMTFSEIQSLRPNGSDYPILSFNEFLNLVDGRTPILIEIKDQGKRKGIEEKVVSALKNYKGEFAVQSFNPIIVKRVSRLAPNFIVGVLTTSVNSMNVPKIVMWFMRKYLFKFFMKIDFLNVNLNEIPSDLKHTKNYYVLCYTIKTPEELIKAKKYADNFIFEKTAGEI
ncbi:MAG: hypothetical protein J6R88_06010, partial [Clostridia bacterium]|nr:hypothetical protein [Clostridia bacterium]